MTVNVGASNAIRFARGVSATDNDYAAIPNDKAEKVHGVTQALIRANREQKYAGQI